MKKFFKNNAIAILTIVCGASVLLSACKKNDPTPIVYGDSYMRIVHTISGSNDQDFYQDNKKISTTAIAYGSASANYYTVKGGPSILSFTDVGSTTTNAALNVGTDEGEYYTVFYYKNGNGIASITGFKDDTNAPPTGKARVRFLNLGFSLNNSLVVKYNSTETAIVNNLGLAISTYNNIEPNTDLGVTVIGSSVTGIIPGSNFVAGKIYTVWFDATSPTTAQFHVVQQN